MNKYRMSYNTAFAAFASVCALLMVQSQELTPEQIASLSAQVFGSMEKPVDKVGEVTTTPFTLQPVTTSSRGQPSNAPCETDDIKVGVCVTYYQCDRNTKEVITDGETLIDTRNRECGHYLEVCCLLTDVNVTKTEPHPVATPQTDCGYSNPGAMALRIVNDGVTAEFGEYPWMVAVLKKTKPHAAWAQSDYVGGGSIIHPQVVLTGAAKIEGLDPEEMKCRAGEWDTQTELEEYPYQERDVRKAVVHDSFYRPSVINNVALLILETPFEITSNTPNVGVGCIMNGMPSVDTVCESMGWGKDPFNVASKYAVIMKKVELPLVSRQSCEMNLRGTRLGHKFQLHQSLTCAGGKDKDTCTGDGGSPLVCPIGPKKDLRYGIVGTVAWGIGCGKEGIPGVYANIPVFKKWINGKMKEEGFDPSSYQYDN